MLLEELPKDIRTVIAKCMFDYNYGILKVQYRDIWLNEDHICWDDSYSVFVCYTDARKMSGTYVCNWRQFEWSARWSMDISKILTGGTRKRVAKLPERYFYSKTK